MRGRHPASFRRPFDWVVYAVVVGFAKLYRCLGPGFGYRVAAVVGALWYVLFRRRREIIHRNLELAFGDRYSTSERDRIGRACCQHALATITDLAVREGLVSPEIPESWREFYEVDDVMESILAEEHPRGLVLLTAHVGSWEMGQYFGALRGRPFSSVVRELDNPYLESEARRLRTRFAGEIVPKQGALLGLGRVLRAGGSIGIAADQSAPADEPIREFFGHPAHVYSSYARVLVRRRPTIIFSVCVRRGFEFRFRTVTKRIEPDASLPEQDRADEVVRLYNEALEEVIREHPDQYIWMHRRWKIRSGPLPDPY